MKFILHSDVDDRSIKTSLGLRDYSYYFLRRAYEPLLARLGSVVVVRDGLEEIDRVYRQSVADGVPCVFFWFGPPDKAPLHLSCPVVPVIAWEFTTIPTEVWSDDPRDDWRHVFALTGRAISQSSFGARVFKEAMGGDFPVGVVPAPTWDRFAGLRARLHSQPVAEDAELSVRGEILDTRLTDLSPEKELPEDLRPEAIAMRVAAFPGKPVASTPLVADSRRRRPPAPPGPFLQALRERFDATVRHFSGWYSEAIRDRLPYRIVWALSHFVQGLLSAIRPPDRPDERVRSDFASRVEATRRHAREWYEEVVVDLLPKSLVPSPPPMPENRLRLDGVIYTAMLNPTCGRKNFDDIVTAFCWAFRERPDATLVLKLVHNDRAAYRVDLERLLNRLSPFRCRVVAFHAFLEQGEFEKLISMTSYCVNASTGEGLCLPLVEFMSCGKPAIAPDHTAMEDYIRPANAFVVSSSKEHNVWPEDPRDLYRTMRYRISWESLRDAFLESHRVATEEPDRYAAMSRAAIEVQRTYSGLESVEERMKAFLAETEKTRAFETQAESGPVFDESFSVASSD